MHTRMHACTHTHTHTHTHTDRVLGNDSPHWIHPVKANFHGLFTAHATKWCASEC